MKAKKVVYKNIFLFFLLVISQAGYAQDNAPKGRIADIFSYPYQKFNFVSARFDHTANKDNTYFNSYTLRAVTTHFNSFHFRADFIMANSNSNEKRTNEFGLADMNVRTSYAVPLHLIHNRLYAGVAAQLTMPTATPKSLGAGKWQGRTGAGLIYFRGTDKATTGTYSLAAEYWFSFAEAEGRSRTNVIAIAPNVDWWIGKWYVGYYATWTYNLDSHVWDIPIDVEAGYSLLSSLTLSAEMIFPLTKDASYKNEWALKLRYSF